MSLLLTLLLSFGIIDSADAFYSMSAQEQTTLSEIVIEDGMEL